MSNEARGMVPGAIRFGDEGRLEIFDGAMWTPLQRLSDADLPPVMRDAAHDPSLASDDGDSGDSGDSDDDDDADDEAPA